MELRLLVLLLLALVSTDAYHILVLSPVPSKSHTALGWGIVDALLKGRHEVTWATPWPPKGTIERLNLIDVSTTIPVGEAMTKAVSLEDRAKNDNDFGQIVQFSVNITKAALGTPALRTAISKGNYDAVVTEWFFSPFDAGYAAILKVPWILLRSVPMDPMGEELMDEVRSLPTIPNLMANNAPIPMNFFERCKNTLSYLIFIAVSMQVSGPLRSVYYKDFAPLAQARGVELPEYSSAVHNVSIMLLISHPSFTPAHSLPPNVVEIAGYHIDEHVPPLPKDLQEILDSSPQGVVYFSMGSILKSAAFPSKLRADLMRMFRSIKQTVLWKFEEQLEDMPPNVHIRAWMPQASILAHPNVILFITHGGMLSHLEALQGGVPLLALPVFGDQPANANRAVLNGYGRKVSFSPHMTEQFEFELNEMLTNDSYLNRARQVSRMFRNRPVAPSKLISHYVEVAIETKGAYHLRSPSKLYSWYQRWMLDQLLALLTLIYLVYRVIKEIYNLVFGKKEKSVKSAAKKKHKRN